MICRKFKLGDVVKLKWSDSFRDGKVWEPWQERSEAQAFCFSIGWITSIGKHNVVISGHMFETEGTKYCGGSLSIPMSSIVSMRKIA
jgi:hypothetical protein